MASYRKLKTGWRAELFSKGRRESRVFDTKKQAEAWAAKRTEELDMLADGIDLSRTVSDILTRYSNEVSCNKKTGKNESVRINRLLKEDVAQIKLIDLSTADFAQWRDNRLKTVSAASVLREMNILHHAFEIARKEWGWVETNPLSDVSRPKAKPPRDRRISQTEIDKMLISLGFYEETRVKNQSQKVAVAFLFAIETAMRAGEICGLTREDISGKVASLGMTKNGTARKVPLSNRALELLALLPENEMFGMNSERLSSLFRKGRLKTDIQDLTFHDSRHEAITRLAKKLNVLELARMVGHRDIKMLSVYYNETAENLAKLLD